MHRFSIENLKMRTDFNKPLIIAHRGASAIAPENTLAAFQKAIEAGAEGIECDVRLAKDGVPVVFHDSLLYRVGRIEGRVSDFTSKELQTLDVGSWFNTKNPRQAVETFSAETVPTLAQLLDFLNDYKGLIYIELKCKEAEIESLVKAVCQIISKSPLLPSIIVKSFKLEAIPIARRLCPEVKTAALFAPKIMTILRKEKRLVKIAHELEADQISLHFSLATRKLMEKAAKKNLAVTIWTADNPRWIKRAISLGVNAIITNNPTPLLAKRQEIIANNY